MGVAKRPAEALAMPIQKKALLKQLQRKARPNAQKTNINIINNALTTHLTALAYQLELDIQDHQKVLV